LGFGAQRLFVFAEFFVIPPHGFRKSIGHRIAIDRGERILRVAPREFLGDSIAHFHQRLDDLELHDRPVRFLLILPPVTTQHARAFARGGKRIAHLRRLDEILHIAQALSPTIEIAAGQRSDTSAFPPTEICGAIRATIENVIEVESSAVDRPSPLVSTPLIARITTIGDLAAIALAGLIAFAGILLALPTLLPARLRRLL
jgi:hypothetical protein